MSQQIKDININELTLWTENPRDPVEPLSSDLDIIKRALEINPSKWNLGKLLEEFGDHYDFSELPTVVIKSSKYIVYDGNRRIALIKCIQNHKLYQAVFQKLFPFSPMQELLTLKRIPCNICDEETALKNIERKHTNNGSWGQLERDYFASNFRNAKKSDFQIIEESTHIISNHSAVNQRFVKEEVLTPQNLEKIGFSISDGRLLTIYPEETTRMVLDNIVNVLENRKISTRYNRQKLKEALLDNNPKLKDVLSPYQTTKKLSPVNLNYSSLNQNSKNMRKTPCTKQEQILFGGSLVLSKGKTNDLYRAIDKIYQNNKNDESILPIIGMSLRLLLETAAREYFERENDRKILKTDREIYSNFIKRTKNNLSAESLNFEKLTLNWLNSEENIEGILGKYAHGEIFYDRSNIIKTSIVVAEILKFYYNHS